MTDVPAQTRDVMLDMLSSLVAAVSLLKRGSKKVAPSNKMFDQMIADYERSIERGRAELQKNVPPPIVQPCIGNAPGCPCQDGDACHYVDLPGSPAMPVKREGHA